MTRHVLRIALSALALLTIFAGSTNPPRAGASVPGGSHPCGPTGLCGCTISSSNICCIWNEYTCYGECGDC